MAIHEVKLSVSPEMDIQGVDIVFTVRSDGEALGRLKISRGSVDWWPAKAKTARRLEWERFSQVMVSEGRRVRRPEDEI